MKEWWEKELGATDSATMLPSPAQPWSRCDLMAANEEQRLALSVMFRHCQDLIAAAAREGREPWMVETLPPLRLIVTGTAGTGKSFIMKAAAFVIERIFGGPGASRATAVSGNAAEAVNGFTICAIAGLHPGRASRILSAQQAAKLQARFTGLIALFIDEMSLLSYQGLADFEEQVRAGVQGGRCASESRVCFGGLPIVVLLGDHGQLGPCENAAVRLCDIKKSLTCERAKRGRLAYLQFGRAVFLQRMQRQSA